MQILACHPHFVQNALYNQHQKIVPTSLAYAYRQTGRTFCTGCYKSDAYVDGQIYICMTWRKKWDTALEHSSIVGYRLRESVASEALYYYLQGSIGDDETKLTYQPKEPTAALETAGSYRSYSYRTPPYTTGHQASNGEQGLREKKQSDLQQIFLNTYIARIRKFI